MTGRGVDTVRNAAIGSCPLMEVELTSIKAAQHTVSPFSSCYRGLGDSYATR